MQYWLTGWRTWVSFLVFYFVVRAICTSMFHMTISFWTGFIFVLLVGWAFDGLRYNLGYGREEMPQTDAERQRAAEAAFTERFGESRRRDSY